MNTLLRILLSAPAFRSLSQRYQRYANNGATVFTAGLTCLLVAFFWLFFKLESPAWQRIRNNHYYWFPHISTSNPRFADTLRYLLQGTWLLLFYPRVYRQNKRYRLFTHFDALRNCYYQYQKKISQRLSVFETQKESTDELRQPFKWSRTLLLWVMSIFSILLAILCISQPFDLKAQFIFVMLLWSIAMAIRHIPGRLPAMMMIVLSLTISCRYMWWRYSSTLNWNDPLSLTFGLLLLMAETYAWLVLVLGYFQTIWPLNRQPVSMPEDVNNWLNVDILIPTYNEDLSVVKPTIYASLGIDWPKEKLHIYS